MKNLIKAARAFYGIGVAGLGAQQFYYKNFQAGNGRILVDYW